MSAPPTLPTPEALDAFWSKLSNVIEELDELVRPAFKAANYEGEQEVTFAHIGALTVFARDIRKQAESLDSTARAVMAVALQDLDVIRLEGRQVDVPSFNEYGHPLSGAEFQRIVKEAINA